MRRSSKMIGGVIVLLLVVSVFLVFKGQPQPMDGPAMDRRIVTDSAGRRVEIPRRPQRVIVLNASNLELFYAAGGMVVGRPSTEALAPEVKEAVRQVPSVGITTNPNIEQIMGLKPDLILGVNMPFHQNLLPLLDEAGIPILLQSLENYQHIIDTLRFYGELTGQPERAGAVIDKLQGDYAALIEHNKGRPAPKVVVIWGSTNSFDMATSRSFSGDLLKRLGAVNVADLGDNGGGQLGYVPLSMEYIARQNPDMVFLITHSADEKVAQKFRNELAAYPAWRGLKAVKDDRVYRLPYQLFAVNPGTQVGEAMRVLDGFLYPEVTER